MKEQIIHKKYLDNILKEIDKNIKLDLNQRKIIISNHRILQVIASAGSGKTTTIAAKVKYLIEKHQVEPTNIVIISFTNKSVQDIKEIMKKLNIKIRIHTFHTFSLNLLKNKKQIVEPENIIEQIIINTIQSKIKDLYMEYPELFSFKLKGKHKIGLINYEKLYKLLIELITIYSTNYPNLKKLETIKKELIYNYLYEIIKFYEQYKQNNNLIDFNDMIKEAILNIEKLNINFKYLFIDEYQDISELRHNLIKGIVDKYNLNLTVVGDDYQSIYGFTGSNVKLFINFKQYYLNSKQLIINKTYRNSKTLNEIADNFINQNQQQISKKVVAIKKYKQPIKIIYYDDYQNKNNNKIKELNQILKNIKEKEVLLIGRFNHDIDFIRNDKDYHIQGNNISYVKNKNLTITFLSAHTAKGLTYEAVIIINNEYGEYGFPSLKMQNKYLKPINNEINQIEEERRLFYVSLTRTKTACYLLTPRYNPSIFIKEIIKIIKENK